MKTAHPPLVGNTARTCTSITVLFIPGERYPRGSEKQAAVKIVNKFGKIFARFSCMLGALNHYAAAAWRRALKKR